MRLLLATVTAFGLSTDLLLAQTAAPGSTTGCNPAAVFRANDIALAEKPYADLPLAAKVPEFPGGEEALQKWFDAHLQLGSQTENMAANLPIALLVNCEGKPTGFKFLGRVLPEVAAQIITTAEAMPSWQPGTSDGKAVDVVIRLSFFIHPRVGVKVSIGR